MVVHKGEYWLFVSKSGGYWRSRDLLHWDFIEPTGFPIEDYAPTVLVIGEKWVLTASDGRAFYACDDPATGKWVKVRDFDRCSDPALLLDDDGRLYMYWGASWDKSIEGIELDPRNNFEPISKPQALIPRADPLHHGWEAMTLTATDDEIKNAQAQPWTEGAWINKHKGVYYLEYAAPATVQRPRTGGFLAGAE
jgi:beta-xylosidase